MSASAIFAATVLLLYPEVRWDYPMQVVPEGWTNDNWGYSPLYGTTLNIWVSSGGQWEEGTLCCGADSVLIPPNCDSIILRVDNMELTLDEEGSGICFAEINYRYYSDWNNAWKQFGNSRGGSRSFSVSIPVTVWEHLSIEFYGVANLSQGYTGSAHLIWGLLDLTLTLWCDGTAIVYDSWGTVKQELGTGAGAP